MSVSTLGATADIAPLRLDEQQRLLLEAVRRAGGAPVSYQQLRDGGIEYPASVVSELVLAGLPLEHRLDGTAADGSPGVRLDPRSDPGEDDAGRAGEGDPLAVPARRQPEQAPGPLSRVARATAPRRLQPRRWLASAALIAAGATLAVLAASDLGGAGQPRRAAGHRRSTERSSVGHAYAATGRPAPTPAAPGTARQAGPAPPQPSAAGTTRVSPVLAAELQARGHEMLEAGLLSDAASALRQALAATGESLAGCLEPTSETCLTYAYALYDLGRALRLDGQAAAAVPILERRLQIANQRATVQSELQLARLEADRPRPGATRSR